MIGKLIALVAFVAAVASANCGFYGNTGYGYGNDRYCSVLNVGPSFPVASCVPSCAPIAVPTCVADPIRTVSAPVPCPIAAPAVAPVVAPVVAPTVAPVVTPVVAPVATETVGCGVVQNVGYLGGCGSRVLSAVY